jgi:tetratricopeptide (TPR) repeat protein
MTYRNLIFSVSLFLFTAAPFAVFAQAGTDTALYNLAIAYEDKGVNEKAIGNYKKVIAAEPKAVDARINLGILYARTGDHDSAIEAYLKAIEQDGQVADAYFNLGIAYGRKAGKTTDESSRSALIKSEINAYGKAVEKNNKAHKAWYNMGIAHRKLGESDKEIAAYLKAVEAKPEYPQALFNLVLAYKDKEQYEQAQKHGEKYVSVAESLTSEKKHLKTVKELLNALKSGSKPTPPVVAPKTQTPPPTAPKK